MPETCYIKDEQGRFMGRKPGCKMEKAGGTLNDSTGGNAASDNTDTENRIKAIMNKPESERTEEEKKTLKNFLDAKAAEIAKQTKDTLLTTVLAMLFAPEVSTAAIVKAIASGAAMDKLTKYAEEKFPGYGAIGVVLAAIALGMAKSKYDSRAMEKAEKKAAAAVAEKKAAAEAEKKAVAEKEAAAAKAEKVREAEKTKEKLGGMYDDIEKESYYSKTTEQKEAISANTGDVSTDEAKKLTDLAEKAKSSTKLDGYKTEATQDRIEHSMMGHGLPEVKKGISDEIEATGKTVRNKYKVPEEKRIVRNGTPNVSLTKDDYQKIPEYREEALESGSAEFQPITADKDFESILYKIPQKDGVIHMVYKIDPAEKKMRFWTMWKEGYPK
jgi:hypothetical protein